MTVLLMAGCDRFPRRSDVGLTTDRSFELIVLFKPCPGERVSRVALSRVDGSGNRHVIWQIDSEEGAPLERLAVGHAPPGYEKSVDGWRGTTSAELEIAITTNLVEGTGFVFRMGQLRPERILLSSGEHVTEYQFETRSHCGG